MKLKMNKKQLMVTWGIFFILIFLCLNISLAQPDLEVNGIFYGEKGQSYAIVNGEVVKVGDKIGEIAVSKISKNAVEFKKGNDSFTKKLTDKISQNQQVRKTEETNTTLRNKTKIPSDKTEGNKIKTKSEIMSEHYKKALEYNKKACSGTHEEIMESYNKAINEAELAIYDTAGEQREETLRFLKVIKQNKEWFLTEQQERLKSKNKESRYFTQDELIGQSRVEIERRREEVKQKLETKGLTPTEKEWHYSGENDPSFRKWTPEDAKENERRNNEQPPPPQVCQGGSCRQATPNEIEEFKK